MKTRVSQQGFTLADLITTMMVAGIAVTVAVPSFDTMVNNNRRQVAVNEFVSTLHAARSEAITRNMRVTVCASESGDACEAVAWNQGWIAFADANADQAVDAGEIVLVRAAEHERVDIGSAEFPAVLSYRPNGRVMAAAVDDNQGDIVFCDPRGADHARVVSITASGSPRLLEAMTDGGDPAC